jgi:hypothetical protein
LFDSHERAVGLLQFIYDKKPRGWMEKKVCIYVWAEALEDAGFTLK